MQISKKAPTFQLVDPTVLDSTALLKNLGEQLMLFDDFDDFTYNH